MPVRLQCHSVCEYLLVNRGIEVFMFYFIFFFLTPPSYTYIFIYIQVWLNFVMIQHYLFYLDMFSQISLWIHFCYTECVKLNLSQLTKALAMLLIVGKVFPIGKPFFLQHYSIGNQSLCYSIHGLWTARSFRVCQIIFIWYSPCIAILCFFY